MLEHSKITFPTRYFYKIDTLPPSGTWAKRFIDGSIYLETMPFHASIFSFHWKDVTISKNTSRKLKTHHLNISCFYFCTLIYRRCPHAYLTTSTKFFQVINLRCLTRILRDVPIPRLGAGGGEGGGGGDRSGPLADWLGLLHRHSTCSVCLTKASIHSRLSHL